MTSIAERVSSLTPEDGELVVERREPLLWIIFNRPKVRNAMSRTMSDRLVEVCQSVNDDRAIRVVVLTGAGGSFVAGADISRLRAIQTEQDVREHEARGNRIWGSVEAIRVPAIAAIAGPCTGGGATIAACCDLRLASPSARYGYPVARTLGNSLSARDYLQLVMLLGEARVKDAVMTARLLDAQELLACGFVREVVATEEALLPRAEELALQVAANAPLTLQATKQAIRRLRDKLAPEGPDDSLLLAYLSNDFKQGIEAFLGKRKPNWTGT